MNKEIEDIKWFRTNKPLDEIKINILSNLPFKLSEIYISLLKDSDGGSPNNSDFQYYDCQYKEYVEQAVGFIYGVCTNDYNIIKEYKNPPEFFPKDLVAFAETGNGDLICFDYRANPTTDNPPIVYWNHEAEIGKDVSFIAKDFEEFLSMLKEPED